MPDYVGHLVNDLRFQHPTCLLVSGTSGSGKSWFIKNIIERNGIKGQINTIFYFVLQMEKFDLKPYSPHTRIFMEQGLPDKKFVDELMAEERDDVLIVIDDQWRDCLKNKEVDRLIRHDRRHNKYSLIFVAQNYFEHTSGGNPKTMK